MVTIRPAVTLISFRSVDHKYFGLIAVIYEPECWFTFYACMIPLSYYIALLLLHLEGRRKFSVRKVCDIYPIVFHVNEYYLNIFRNLN